MHIFTELAAQVITELTGDKLAAFGKKKKRKTSNLATKEAARRVGLVIIEAQADCITEKTTAGHPNDCCETHSIFLKNRTIAFIMPEVEEIMRLNLIAALIIFNERLIVIIQFLAG